MHMSDTTDFHIFIIIATILFLILAILLHKENVLNALLKVLCACMAGFGFLLLVGIYSA